MIDREVGYRHQQLLAEAARNRLARLAGAQRITFYQRFSLWLGNTLISAGVELRRRGTPRHTAATLVLTPFESQAQY
jgi:hypothetical protein